MNARGEVFGINGPVLTIITHGDFRMSEMVLVGEERLIGEVIAMDRERAVIQVFEDTVGLKPGAEVLGTGGQLSVTLGPGIIGNIFDGIERPLKSLERDSGVFISRGVHVDNLDMEKLWDVKILVKPGDRAEPGLVVAETAETVSIVNRIMIPPGVNGYFKTVAPGGRYKLADTIAVVAADKRETRETSPLPDGEEQVVQADEIPISMAQ
ncbi:MAG: V-type ATP synthase subunit A, partial [Clostridiales bacterium]|nr:V-type ATP synthase subunit A [Clostridiales bacterium]